MSSTIGWLRAKVREDLDHSRSRPWWANVLAVISTPWALPLVFRAGARVWAIILRYPDAEPELRELWRLDPIADDVDTMTVFTGAIAAACFGALMLSADRIDPAANPALYLYASSLWVVLVCDPLTAAVSVVIDR